MQFAADYFKLCQNYKYDYKFWFSRENLENRIFLEL